MHKTAAITAELAQQRRIALAAVVHALVLSEFGFDLHLYRSKSCLQMSSSQPCLREAEAGIAFLLLEEQRNDWFGSLSRSGGLVTSFPKEGTDWNVSQLLPETENADHLGWIPR